jgi:tRNA threonylcarbamoyl adenosine modification protein (Sua5/YciO/YrdC/YwlC family)
MSLLCPAVTILDARRAPTDEEAMAAAVDRVGAELRAGRCVVVPTDTVYGLAALLSAPAAVDGLAALKGRPRSVPIALLVTDLTQATEVADLTPAATALARRHWPGPLTLVVDAAPGIGTTVGSEDGSVGVRCPDHPLLRALAAVVGPLATTSANRHGEPPATTAADAAAAFPTLGLVVDGGVCDGVVSTVVDVRTATPEILRQGGVDLA